MAGMTFGMRMTTLCLAFLAGLSLAATPVAQPVTGHVIDRISVDTQGDCFLITVRLTIPMQYLGHFPPDSGDVLRIRLNPVVTGIGSGGAPLMSESARPYYVDGLPLEEVTYEGDAPEPYLILQFAHPVAYTVAQGEDFRGIVIRVRPPGTEAGQACPPSATPAD